VLVLAAVVECSSWSRRLAVSTNCRARCHRRRGHTGPIRLPTRRTVTPIFVQLRETTNEEAKLEGLVFDVSQGGLGLSLKQPVAVGTVLEVRVTIAAPSVPWTQVEVRNCSQMSSRWKIGCRFVHEPERQVRMLFG